MKKISVKVRLADVIFSLSVVAMLVSLVLFPALSVSAASDGLALCVSAVIPSLFPFFVVSSIAVKLRLSAAINRKAASLMSPLFHLGGGCSGALILGLLGGYPVGARTAAELYSSGACTKAEAEHMLAFCNNCGPAFILGIAGTAVYQSISVGAALLGIHILSSILTGILLRGRRSRASAPKFPLPHPADLSFFEIFTSAVRDSADSIIGVCGFIIFFSVVIKLLEVSGVFSPLSELSSSVLKIPFEGIPALLKGSIELSSGIFALKGISDMRFSLTAAAFILGWGGLSVHFQTLSVISGSGLSAKKYFIGKLLHGVISAAVAYPLSVLMPFSISAFARESPSITHFLRAGTVPIFFILISSVLCLCIFFLLSGVYLKKHMRVQNKKAKK